MIKFIAIFFTIWFIIPSCDPGWRYRAANKSGSAMAEHFEIKVEAHYFGGSDVELILRNISEKELSVAPLYSYAKSLACPGQIQIPYRVKIVRNSKIETYYLHLPPTDFSEADKSSFDARKIWGKTGSVLKRSLGSETDSDERFAANVNLSELNRTYLIQPNAMIKLTHYLPTFSCKYSALGYPNDAGQAFELTIPFSEVTGPIILIVDKAAASNR